MAGRLILRAVAALLMAAALGCAHERERFPGDEALALAGSQWNDATQEAAEEKLRAVLGRLSEDRERLSRHRVSKSARFVKAEKFLEIGELSDVVLIARQGAKIGQASNVKIIAQGGVEVSVAKAVVVVASGPIRIAHEMPEAASGGAYVTRASVQISHARDAMIYAVGGARYSHGASVRLYNTRVEGLHIPVAADLPGRMFEGEPVWRPAQGVIVSIAGQAYRYGGARCAAGMYIELLEKELTAALKNPGCGEIESVSVRCEQDGGALGSGLSVERWSFRGCGRTLQVVSRTNPYTRSVVLDRSGDPASRGLAPPLAQPLTSLTLTETERRAISALFNEASLLAVRQDIVRARAKYAEVLKIAPDYGPALQNIASYDARVARADAAAAPFTKLIDAGKRDGRTYADRGLAYVAAGDLGRGLADLDTAAARSPADAAIRLEQIDAYLRTGRSAECVPRASDAIGRFPRQAKAYELRAWCNLMENRGGAAIQDARRALAEGEPWTRESFARERAGYRVVAGYFGLRQTASREQARDWLGQWRSRMSPAAWPDAFALYLLGELDHDSMNGVAAGLRAQDRGNASGEAAMFVALEVHFHSGSDAAARSKATEVFRSGGYRAGYTLGLALSQALTTPARQIKRREELEAKSP